MILSRWWALYVMNKRWIKQSQLKARPSVWTVGAILDSRKTRARELVSSRSNLPIQDSSTPASSLAAADSAPSALVYSLVVIPTELARAGGGGHQTPRIPNYLGRLSGGRCLECRKSAHPGKIQIVPAAVSRLNYLNRDLEFYTVRENNGLSVTMKTHRDGN